jgi:glycosyltransferase involved in cell wall biosynthesis
MRITVVSRSWPSHERSGVTLAVAEHVRILAAAGHIVSIIGSHPAVLREQLPVSARFHVPARGSGAVYAPARINRRQLASTLRHSAPDLVIVEAWQTALTDAAVSVASSLEMPTLMISHGSSLHSFTSRPLDRLRALAWLPYRRTRLPGLISCLSALTTLDETATSARFFDRDLARRLGVPVVPLTNSPANWTERIRDREQRTSQILVVGYFSPIKNQLAALEVAARLPSLLHFLFVGPRQGRYFDRCVRRAEQLGLATRTRFAEDHECDLADEISRSLVVLSTSITEALPLTLIEAMAAGTPFVATPVGAVPSLRGGILARDIAEQNEAIQTLASDRSRWQRCADDGRMQFAERFSARLVESQLRLAVDVAMHRRPRAQHPATPAQAPSDICDASDLPVKQGSPQ